MIRNFIFFFIVFVTFGILDVSAAPTPVYLELKCNGEAVVQAAP